MESIDTIFNCVVPYIQDINDRNSASLVCRKWCELEGLTRKHVTIHMHYYTTPFRLHRRFPYLESLTLKGMPLSHKFGITRYNISQLIQNIAWSFNGLKSLHVRNMIVRDFDLWFLAGTRGKQLRVLKIESCRGFSTDGLLYIGKYCSNLRILSLQDSWIDEKDGKWLHELALRNTCIESLNFYDSWLRRVDIKDLTLIAKNCSQSLVSVKIAREKNICRFLEFFSYAVRDFLAGIVFS